MSKLLGVLLVLVLVATAAAYAGSPLYAFHELKAAARSGDRARLESLVDFPAVREDLKRQVGSKVTRLAGRAAESGSPLAAILGQLGAALGDRAIDDLVTPDAIISIVEFGRTPLKLHKDESDEAGAGEQTGDGRTRVRFGYLSPNWFRASVAPAADPDRPIDLMFQRHGLVSWRLEAVELPK